MSAVAQTVSGVKASQPRSTAWKELRRLIRTSGLIRARVARLTYAPRDGFDRRAAAFDCRRNNGLSDQSAGTDADLTASSHAGAVTLWHTVLKPIIFFYQPGSRHTLLILCLLLVAAVVVKGVFSFASRWILIGISRDIEFDLRNNLLARLVAIGARVLRAQSHGRIDVASHKRFERCAHGSGPGNHV